MNSLQSEVRHGPQAGYCCCSCRKLDSENCSLDRIVYKCGVSGHPVYSSSCLASTSSSSTKAPPCTFCQSEISMAMVEDARIEDFDIVDGTQNSQIDIIDTDDEDEDMDEDEVQDDDDELDVEISSSSSQSQSKKRKELNADGSTIESNMDFSLESFFKQTQHMSIVEPFAEFFRHVLVPVPQVGGRAQYNEKCSILHNNLFGLLSAIVFYNEDDGVVTDGSMKIDDQYTGLVIRFNNLFRNMHLQSKYKTCLFDYFPNEKWPDGFEAWIDQKSKSPATKTFKKKHKVDIAKFKDGELELFFFGHQIRETAKKVKEYVTGKMNPLWMDEFPSGYNQTGIYSLLFY